MQTGEISTCSSSTRSFDSPESSDRRQSVSLSPIQSQRTAKTRTIAIALKAHERLRNEPFAYAFNHLVEQRNCKVVIVSCLSHLQDERCILRKFSEQCFRNERVEQGELMARVSHRVQYPPGLACSVSCGNLKTDMYDNVNAVGVDRIIDVETFGGVSKRKLETAVNMQMNNLNHFLKAFRERLDQRGVQLDIRVTTGPKSADILVHAARALRPHWVVLDRSFSGCQRQIQEALECNLVLMKKSPKQMPEILKLMPTYLCPINQIQDQISEEELGFVGGDPSPDLSWRTPSSAFNGSSSSPFSGTSPTVTSNHSVRIQNTIEATSSSSNSKAFTCITCLCVRGKAGNELVDGPTDKQTVLYGTTVPGSQATYLGRVGLPSMNPEVSPSTRITSPEGSPTGFFFKLGSSSAQRKSSKKSIRMIEQQMEAQMAMPPLEEDGRFQVQL